MVIRCSQVIALIEVSSLRRGGLSSHSCSRIFLTSSVGKASQEFTSLSCSPNISVSAIQDLFAPELLLWGRHLNTAVALLACASS